MKLASMRGGRDGALIIVSDDLSRAALAEGIVPTLQAALDNWDTIEPKLRRVADSLEAGHLKGSFDLDDFSMLTAPLPR